jgi:hypothetical protein
METIVGEFEITKLLNNYVDLFEFMKLDKTKYSDSDFMFTDEYNKELKKAAIKNNRKYHTDKYPNASADEKEELERMFNLNQIVYYILKNKEVYDQYVKLKSEIVFNHNELRDNFVKLSNDDIKRIIKESSNDKSFEELSREKDMSHGIDRSLEKKLSEDETNDRITELINQRTNLYENVKKNTPKMEVNDDNKKFTEMFNKEFDKNIHKNINSYEIQSYNDFGTVSTTFNYQNFDYGSMFDSNYQGMNDSFALLSTNIPDQVLDDTSLEDKIKQYTDLTKHYENITKHINVKTEQYVSESENNTKYINVKTEPYVSESENIKL